MRAPEKKVQRPAAQRQWPVMTMLPTLSVSISGFCLSSSLPLCFFLALLFSLTPRPTFSVSLSLSCLLCHPPPDFFTHTQAPPHLSQTPLSLSLTCSWTSSDMPSDSAAHKMNFVYDVPFAQSQIWTRVPTGKD